MNTSINENEEVTLTEAIRILENIKSVDDAEGRARLVRLLRDPADPARILGVAAVETE